MSISDGYILYEINEILDCRILVILPGRRLLCFQLENSKLNNQKQNVHADRGRMP